MIGTLCARSLTRCVLRRQNIQKSNCSAKLLYSACSLEKIKSYMNGIQVVNYGSGVVQLEYDGKAIRGRSPAHAFLIPSIALGELFLASWFAASGTNASNKLVQTFLLKNMLIVYQIF